MTPIVFLCFPAETVLQQSIVPRESQHCFYFHAHFCVLGSCRAVLSSSGWEQRGAQNSGEENPPRNWLLPITAHKFRAAEERISRGLKSTHSGGISHPQHQCSHGFVVGPLLDSMISEVFSDVNDSVILGSICVLLSMLHLEQKLKFCFLLCEGHMKISRTALFFHMKTLIKVFYNRQLKHNKICNVFQFLPVIGLCVIPLRLHLHIKDPCIYFYDID